MCYCPLLFFKFNILYYMDKACPNNIIGEIELGTKILSTGVLRRHTDTSFITVEALNADPDSFRSVTVQLFDWSSGFPVTLPLLDPATISIPPSQYRTFRSLQLPASVSVYEVRIIHPKDKDVVVSTFGLSALDFDPQVGNFALQHDLTRLSLK